MQEVFEKIIKKLEEQIKEYDDRIERRQGACHFDETENMRKLDDRAKGIEQAVEIVKQAAAECNNGWIPCRKKMPPVETEVFILAKRKFKGGDCMYIRTTAMYEDGKVLENDSCWFWQDIEGEWDEENECYIIPEGWWENRHYNPDDVYNNAIDDEIVAWQPLPEPYHPKKRRTNCANRHKNGNCLAVGGFCTAVDDKYCKYQPEGE